MSFMPRPPSSLQELRRLSSGGWRRQANPAVWKPLRIAAFLIVGAVPIYFWLFNEFIYHVVELPFSSGDFFALGLLAVIVPIAFFAFWIAQAMWRSGLTQGLFGFLVVLWLLAFVSLLLSGAFDSITAWFGLLLVVVPSLILLATGVLLDYVRVRLRTGGFPSPER